MKIRGVHATAFTAANSSPSPARTICTTPSPTPAAVMASSWGADSHISGMSQSNRQRRRRLAHRLQRQRSRGSDSVAATSFTACTSTATWAATGSPPTPISSPSSSCRPRTIPAATPITPSASAPPEHASRTVLPDRRLHHTLTAAVTWINVGNANLYLPSALPNSCHRFENINSPNVSRVQLRQ